MAAFENEMFEITCPDCGKQVKKIFGSVGSSLQCSCGTTFDSSQIADVRNKMNKQLKDFRKDMTRTININLKM